VDRLVGQKTHGPPIFGSHKAWKDGGIDGSSFAGDGGVSESVFQPLKYPGPVATFHWAHVDHIPAPASFGCGGTRGGGRVWSLQTILCLDHLSQVVRERGEPDHAPVLAGTQPYAHGAGLFLPASDHEHVGHFL
jgi:hypothetical protein